MEPAEVWVVGVSLSYLLASVKETLAILVNVKLRLDALSKILDFRQFAQTVESDGLRPVHRPYPDPHREVRFDCLAQALPMEKAAF